MITLTNERGLITSPQSWEEIESIPGYLRGLSPSEHKLKSVIGSYNLKDIHCGLTCNQLHDKGYIVVTENGTVTNIGHVCGRNYFGTDFATFTNQYNRDVTAQNNRDLLFTFDLQIEELEQEIKNLRESKYGVDWIYKTSKILISKNDCPIEIVRTLEAMIKARSSILKKTREVSENEIQRIEVATGRKIKRPYIVEEVISNISGIEILYEEKNLRRLVVIELEEKIKSFKSMRIDELTYAELSKQAKWVHSIEFIKEEIKDAMNAGVLFLNVENLRPLLQILSNKNDIKNFTIFLNNLGCPI